MITIKYNKGIDTVEFYIEPEEIKFLKKVQGKYSLQREYTLYYVKLDNEWYDIEDRYLTK